MRLLMRLLITAAVIFGVAYFSGGSLLAVDGAMAAFWAAVVLGLVNMFVKPIVSLLSLPITILTLGLFALVINALMLNIVAALVPGVSTVGFFQTLLAALLISFASSALTKITEKDE